MTPTTLVRAIELRTLIETTSLGIKELQHLKDKARVKPTVRGFGTGSGLAVNNLYNLHIAEHGDGSGAGRAALTRYEGNDELLDIIIATLNRQLKTFQTEFESL